jgi:hypothetical protein
MHGRPWLVDDLRLRKTSTPRCPSSSTPASRTSAEAAGRQWDGLLTSIREVLERQGAAVSAAWHPIWLRPLYEVHLSVERLAPAVLRAGLRQSTVIERQAP